MTERLHWTRDGADWPNRHASRFVQAAGLRWHIQSMGQGPVMLLVHGTGASTHSWRDLAPLLASRFNVVAIDLPGHAFTDALPRARQSLGGMANAVAALADRLNLRVSWIIGHSAGAAIAARMILDRHIAPDGLIGLNAAMLPLRGAAGLAFPLAARVMASTSIAARLFAWRACAPAAVARMIESTGSTLDSRGIELYGRLMRDVRHVSGALDMMAHWDLTGFANDLRRLTTPSTWLVGNKDRAVPSAHIERMRLMLPSCASCRMTMLCGAGHLAHEERPDAVARFIDETVPAP